MVRGKIGPYKNRMKEYRELVMTQAELAERLRKRGFKASESYISQIEAGLKNIPYGLAVAICEELGIGSAKVTEIFLPKYFTGSEDNNNRQPNPNLIGLATGTLG